jgi:hypothetical protein
MTSKLKCKRCGYEWDYKGKSEFYCTCPKCLGKVRVTAIAGEKNAEQEPIQESKPPLAAEDPAAVRAAREEWCKKFIDEQAAPICWQCGPSWKDFFVCKECAGEFHLPKVDARHCPACGSSPLYPYWEIDIVRDLGAQSIDDMIDDLDKKKFPDRKPGTGREDEKPLTKKTKTELVSLKAAWIEAIDKEISRRFKTK